MDQREEVLRMPPEWAAHARTWMAWPSTGYTLGEDPETARAAWAGVANAVVAFEPVTMVVAPTAYDVARAALDARVELVKAPLDDAWMRDMGPTFVVDGTGALCAVDWVFNGWGAQEWARWGADAQIGRYVATHAGARVIASPLVNEGGAIHTDGNGTVLVTETVQLDPGRNPGWDRARVEAELQRTIGAERVVWLSRGLTRDYDAFGTRGHVDIVAAFTPSGAVLVHRQDDPGHPDHEVGAALEAELRAAGLQTIALPAPAATHDDAGPVDYSYVNHYVVNGGVVLCGFGEPEADGHARAILAEAYPGREVVLVDARPLFARGGGIHCITQQEPAT